MPFIGMLEEFGLKNFVKYKGYWSAAVIRAFLRNLEYRVRERAIYSKVRGKKICLDELKFVEVLGLTPPESTAHCFTDHHHSLSQSFYGNAEVYKIVTREPKFTGKTIRVSNTDASFRFLLNVITHILFNKSGNWACGSELEFFAMSFKEKPLTSHTL